MDPACSCVDPQTFIRIVGRLVKKIKSYHRTLEEKEHILGEGQYVAGGMKVNERQKLMHLPYLVQDN